MAYEFLEHTADVKVFVKEKTMEKAFSSSADALKETICGKIKVKSGIEKKISVEGKNIGALLYNFLEEFLYLLDAEGFLLSKVKEIKILKEKGKAFKLTAVAFGDKASGYKFSNDVKAITYNDMEIKTSGGKFIIQFVLDV